MYSGVLRMANHHHYTRRTSSNGINLFTIQDKYVNDVNFTGSCITLISLEEPNFRNNFYYKNK